MKQQTFSVVVLMALVACGFVPQAQTVPPNQPTLPLPTQSPAQDQGSQHPSQNILGKWTISKTHPLKAKYYAVNAQGGSYFLPFSFEMGEVGGRIEFSPNALVYDAVAYEYQWVDNERIKVGVNMGLTGTIWLVYEVKLDGGKLSLLDARDGNVLVGLSKP